MKPTTEQLVAHLNDNADKVLARIGDNGIFKVYGMNRYLTMHVMEDMSPDDLHTKLSHISPLNDYTVETWMEHILDTINTDVSNHVDALTEIFNSYSQMKHTMQLFCADTVPEHRHETYFRCGYDTVYNKIWWKAGIHIIGEQHTDKTKKDANQFVDAIALIEKKLGYRVSYAYFRHLMKSDSYSGDLSERVNQYIDKVIGIKSEEKG